MSIRVAEDSGDDWTEVVDLHDATLRRFIGRQTPDRDLVDDILQETYLRAVRSGRHPRRAELTDEGWLRMLARRASVDAYRGAKRRAAPVDYLTMVGEPVTVDGAVTPGSDEHLDAMASREAVRWAFQRLTPRQQRLLVLRGVEELTYQEMALAEETTVEAMASALNRARERLRAGIKRYQGRGPRGLSAVVPFVPGALRRMRERFARAHALLSPHLMELAGATVAIGVAGVLTAGAGHSEPVFTQAVAAGADAGLGVLVDHRPPALPLRDTATSPGVPGVGSPPTTQAPRSGAGLDDPVGFVGARPEIVVAPERTWVHLDLETPQLMGHRGEGTVSWDCAASTLASRGCQVLERLPGVERGASP